MVVLRDCCDGPASAGSADRRFARAGPATLNWINEEGNTDSAFLGLVISIVLIHLPLDKILSVRTIYRDMAQVHVQ